MSRTPEGNKANENLELLRRAEILVEKMPVDDYPPRIMTYPRPEFTYKITIRGLDITGLFAYETANAVVSGPAFEWQPDYAWVTIPLEELTPEKFILVLHEMGHAYQDAAERRSPLTTFSQRWQETIGEGVGNIKDQQLLMRKLYEDTAEIVERGEREAWEMAIKIAMRIKQQTGWDIRRYITREGLEALVMQGYEFYINHLSGKLKDLFQKVYPGSESEFVHSFREFARKIFDRKRVLPLVDVIWEGL